MKTKAEEALSGLRKDEMASSHAYQMLKQSLDTQLKADQKRMNAASTEKSATTEAKASAEEDLAATEKALAADTSYLEDLKTKCAMKGDEWAARQKSAGEEIQAIEKAREILSDGVKVFLQVGKSTASTKDDQDKRMKVTQILRRISRDAHQFQLTQITAASQNDEFSKVRGLVEAMIARLTQEAAEEADAKSFCDTETAKSKAKQADLSAKADMHAARVEKGTAEKAKLEGEVKQIQEQLAAMDAGQAEATKLRSEEKAAYKQASSDYKQSADAVASAIEVLSEYYNKGSFVQVASSVRQAPDFNAGKTDVAGTIMEMLEVAESDFTRLLAEADADESQAQEAFDKLVQENAVTKAAKQAEIRGNEGQLKQLQTALLNSKEDASTTAKELDATLAYLDKLKPQCESKVMTYAERVQKREDEIAGLKEALEILEA
jgi:chromosome segregation ATPase